MLKGLSADEFERLKLSVDIRSNSRPLSPAEVFQSFEKALEAGETKSDIAKGVGLSESMVDRFRKLARLHPDVRHLIDWGRTTDGVLGFSTASELSRMPAELQEEAAQALLKHSFIKSEVISLVQLVERSGEPLDACVSDIIGRRPVTHVVNVAIGSVRSPVARAKLESMLQQERNEVLKKCLEAAFPTADILSARLAPHKFSIAGRKKWGDILSRQSQLSDRINDQIDSHLGVSARDNKSE